MQREKAAKGSRAEQNQNGPASRRGSFARTRLCYRSRRYLSDRAAEVAPSPRELSISFFTPAARLPTVSTAFCNSAGETLSFLDQALTCLLSCRSIFDRSGGIGL